MATKSKEKTKTKEEVHKGSLGGGQKWNYGGRICKTGSKPGV